MTDAERAGHEDQRMVQAAKDRQPITDAVREVQKWGVAHLTAGERFQVFEYVSQQPEQGDLFES